MHDLEEHPNLIRLVDVYACHKPHQYAMYDGPYICIVTEFVEAAEPLSRKIAAGGPQPGLASHVILQLAEALAIVHRRGLVHRDVWSENVLLKSNGSVVLVDFGAAVRYDTGDIVTDELNIPYVAPETSVRARQGPGEDCWAVGLLLSEIVTGKFLRDRIGTKPIPAYSDIRVMNEVRSETAAIGGRVLGELCVDLLNFDPASRTVMKDVHAYLSCATSLAKSICELRCDSISQASTQEPSPETTPRPHLAPRLSSKRAVSHPVGSMKQNLLDTCFDTSALCGNCKILAEGATSREIACITVQVDAHFEAGARVAYFARSNGVYYTGVVEGRSLDGKGLRLRLDCGDSKIVPDSDAWRVSRIT
jgi:serine/threonine protein kinase